MNKTMTMIAVVLTLLTAFYVANYAENVDGEVHTTFNGEDYVVISDAGDRCYTDSEMTYSRIYIDSATVTANAFRDCSTSLQYVVLGESVRTVGDSAFEGCTRLGYVSGQQVISLGAYSFKDTGITNAEFGPSLTAVGPYAFSGCTKLMAPVLSGTNVSSLEDGVFAGSRLKIEDMRNVARISDTAFQGATVGGQIVSEGQSARIPGIP